MRFEIRERDMLGALVATVDVATDDRGRATDPEVRGQRALEVAANRAASLPAIIKRFGGPRSGFGINRETGVVGMSGIFSLRGSHSKCGAIHVCEE